MRNRLEKVFLLDVGIWILTGCGAPKDRNAFLSRPWELCWSNAFLQHLENSIAMCGERSCKVLRDRSQDLFGVDSVTNRREET